MIESFPIELLRKNSPTQSSFIVSAIPCEAKLDQNESPVDLPEETKRLIADDLLIENWNRYPQPGTYNEIKNKFAESISQNPENIILTCGCDQMILLAFQAAGGAGRRATIFEPTYPMFNGFANITQTKLQRIVLGPDFDIESIPLNAPTDILFLVRPNNPTGGGPTRDYVEKAVKKKSLIFVDEAYADYSDDTVIDLLCEHPNLLIARSLSKSLLAGIRLGYGIGHPTLINVLEQLTFSPYHLNALQLSIAKHYSKIKPHLQTMITKVRSERDRVSKEIKKMGVKVWPSQANFVLFQVKDSVTTYQKLLNNKVRIRDVSKIPGMHHHLRVTIGTSKENNLFLNALKKSIHPCS